MEPTPRAEIEGMDPYRAPLEGRRKLLRLDFNENTIGPSPRVVEALQNIPANQIAIYPEYNGLREAVIESLTKRGLRMPLDPSQVGIFNGVDAAIHAVFQAYGNKDDQLLTTTPTFGYYTPCAEMQGMEIIQIQYEGNDFEFPLNKIKKILSENNPKLFLLCNPNNPTGTRLSPIQVLELTKSSPKTLIVVDELYEAFTGDSVIPMADFISTPNLLVLRSLSKTAGLAGLRIGFAIGNSSVIDRINRVTGPYDINSFAVQAAFAALADQSYIDSYIEEVLKARRWIEAKLKRSGIRFHLAGGNYLLIWPSQKANELTNRLKEKGILIRNMNGKDLIDGSLRVSIGTQSQMQQFWEAFSRLEEFSF